MFCFAYSAPIFHFKFCCLGTFKYHMTPGEGICSNRQSTIIWGRGFGQIVI